MEEFILFFVVVMIVLTIMNYVNKNKNIVYVKSRIDERKYLVRKLPDAKVAADKLAELNIKIKKIIDKCLTNKDYPDIDSNDTGD